MADVALEEFQKIAGWLCMLYWVLSIPMGFMTGFVTTEGDLVTQPARTAKHYVRTWFFFDATLVSADLVFISLDRPESLAGRGLRTIRFFTFIRTIRMNAVFERATRRLSSSQALIVLHLAKWFFVMLAVIHIVGCGMYGLGISYDRSRHTWIDTFEVEHRSFGYRYMTSAHWSLSQFAATKVEIRPTNTAERFFAVATGAVAVILNPWMVSKITTSLVGLQVMKQGFTEKKQRLRKYLRKYDISLETRGRIWKIVNQQTSSDEHCHQGSVELLHILPAQTRAALRAELYRPVLTCFPFFRLWMRDGHEAHMVYDLVTEVLNELFVPKSHRLFGKGEVATRAYFLAFGLVQYAESVVRKRDLLCEQALWLDWMHLGTATALEDADLFAIDADSFRRVFADVKYARRYACKFNALALQGSNLAEVCDRDLAEGLAENVFETAPERERPEPMARSPTRTAMDRVLSSLVSPTGTLSTRESRPSAGNA